MRRKCKSNIKKNYYQFIILHQMYIIWNWISNQLTDSENASNNRDSYKEKKIFYANIVEELLNRISFYLCVVVRKEYLWGDFNPIIHVLDMKHFQSIFVTNAYKNEKLLSFSVGLFPQLEENPISSGTIAETQPFLNYISFRFVNNLRKNLICIC